LERQSVSDQYIDSFLYGNLAICAASVLYLVLT